MISRMLDINSVMNFTVIGQTDLLQRIGPMELLLFFVLIAVLAVVIALAVMICVKPKRRQSNLSGSTNYELSRSDTKPKEVVGEIGQGSTTENDSSSPEDRNWCMFIHLSQFCNYIIPITGLIAPLILWLMKKDRSALIDLHGRIVMNWIITEFILAIVFVILCFVLVGIPLLLGLLVVSFVFPILGAVKVQNGETWIYPFSFKFLKLDF